MISFSFKLAAAGGLALLAFSLVAADVDSTSPHALKRSTFDGFDNSTSTLLAPHSTTFEAPVLTTRTHARSPPPRRAPAQPRRPVPRRREGQPFPAGRRRGAQEDRRPAQPGQHERAGSRYVALLSSPSRPSRRRLGGGQLLILSALFDGFPDSSSLLSLLAGTNNQQGTGQQNVNSTSGLPADIVDTGDPQKNLFIDPSQVAKGLANDGQAVPTAGTSSPPCASLETTERELTLSARSASRRSSCFGDERQQLHQRLPAPHRPRTSFLTPCIHLLRWRATLTLVRRARRTLSPRSQPLTNGQQCVPPPFLSSFLVLLLVVLLSASEPSKC